MTVRHMRIFVSLYENGGNVTKTADALFLTQPAVSVALSELEAYYNVKLFDRISRRLHVNEAGTRFYDYAKRILNMFNDMEVGMRNIKAKQLLRIGVCDSLDACTLPRYITEFTSIHPGITIQSSVDTGDGMIEKISHNEIDLAIIDKVCTDRKIVSIEFTAADLRFGVAPGLGFQDEQEIGIEELVKHALILRERGSGVRTVFDTAMHQQGYNVQPIFEGVGNVYALNATIQGLGICCLPANIMHWHHKHGKLLYLNVSGLALTLPYKIIRHCDNVLPEFANDFIEICKTSNIVE